MNIEGVLFRGSPSGVEKDTREHIENLSNNGAYVVASSHSVVDAIPLANYRSMINAAVKYGTFVYQIYCILRRFFL